MATPKGMPEYAKGTKQAIAESKAQTYDQAKARKNAENAEQKKIIAQQVVKQSPTKETFVEAKKAMPVYATGDVAKIKDYTASNVAQMTEKEKKDAFEKAVQTRMGVEKELAGTRVVPMSSTEIRKRAEDAVTQNLQTAQERIAGSGGVSTGFPTIPPMPLTATTPLDNVARTTDADRELASRLTGYYSNTPTAQEIAATAPVVTTSATPSSQQSPYVALGEAAKPENVPIATPTSIITTSDVGTPKKKTQAELDAEYAKQYNLTGAFRNANLEASQREQAPAWLGEYIPTAVTAEEDARAKAQAQTQPPAPVATQPPAPELKPITIMQPEEQLGAPQLEQYDPEQAFRLAAMQQVDKDIQAQNAELDRQMEQARIDNDTQQQTLIAGAKDRLRQMQDQNFQAFQTLQQQMANRGLARSGLAQDAQVRLQMNMNQQMRQLNQQIQVDQQKLSNAFMSKLSSIEDKRQKIASGREIDVDKLTKSMIKDYSDVQKSEIDLRKLQLEENKMLLTNAQDTLDRYAKQGYDTSAFDRYLASGNVQGLANAMAQSSIPQLSLIGKDIVAAIESTNSQVALNKMKAKESLSQIDKQRSDTTGFIYQNGVPLKDAKGNYVMTDRAKQFVQKLQFEVKKAETSNALKNAELSLKKFIDTGRISIAKQRLDQDASQFKKRMDQDYLISLNKLQSQDARTQLANDVAFGKELLKSATSKLSSLLASGKASPSSDAVKKAMLEQYAAKQALGGMIGVDYKDETMETLLKEKE